MKTPSDLRWYQLPLAWLGIAALVASLASCVVIVVLSVQHPDDPVPVIGDQLLKMPAARGRTGQ